MRDLASLTDTSGDPIKSSNGDLSDNTGGPSETLGDRAGDLAEDVGEIIEDVIEDAQDVTEDIGAGIANLAEDLGINVVAETVGDVAEEVGGHYKDVAVDVGGHFEDAVADLGDHLGLNDSVTVASPDDGQAASVDLASVGPVDVVEAATGPEVRTQPEHDVATGPETRTQPEHDLPIIVMGDEHPTETDPVDTEFGAGDAASATPAASVAPVDVVDVSTGHELRTQPEHDLPFIVMGDEHPTETDPVDADFGAGDAASATPAASVAPVDVVDVSTGQEARTQPEHDLPLIMMSDEHPTETDPVDTEFGAGEAATATAVDVVDVATGQEARTQPEHDLPLVMMGDEHPTETDPVDTEFGAGEAATATAVDVVDVATGQEARTQPEHDLPIIRMGDEHPTETDPVDTEFGAGGTGAPEVNYAQAFDPDSPMTGNEGSGGYSFDPDTPMDGDDGSGANSFDPDSPIDPGGGDTPPDRSKVIHYADGTERTIEWEME